MTATFPAEAKLRTAERRGGRTRLEWESGTLFPRKSDFRGLTRTIRPRKARICAEKLEKHRHSHTSDFELRISV